MSAGRIEFFYELQGRDPAAEDKFWDNAVDKAHSERISNPEQEPTSERTLVDGIMVRCKPDSQYPTDPDYDWDTVIYIYTDEQTHKYYYSLEENFLSLWDAFPVYRGGPISRELFIELMERIGNHKYLQSGEVVSMENYNKESENNLLEMIKQKEEADKRLLRMEIVLGIIAVLPLIAATIIACIVPMEEWKAGLLVGLSLIPLLIAMPFTIKIEQKAGFYECQKCGHRYIPSYGKVFFAMHVNRTRFMRCPKCGEISWQKKVIRKDKADSPRQAQ